MSIMYLVRIFAERGAAAGVDAGVLGVPVPAWQPTPGLCIGSAGFRGRPMTTWATPAAFPCKHNTRFSFGLN